MGKLEDLKDKRDDLKDKSKALHKEEKHWRDVRENAIRMLQIKDVQEHPKKKEFWQERREKANNHLDRIPERLQGIHYRVTKVKDRIKQIIASRTPNFNGCPTNVTAAARKFVLRANRAGLIISATSNGGHAPGSYHFTNPCSAIDCYGYWDRMIAFQAKEAKRGYDKYNELFGPDSYYVKNGVRFAGAFPAHGDHVHGAPRQ